VAIRRLFPVGRALQGAILRQNAAHRAPVPWQNAAVARATPSFSWGHQSPKKHPKTLPFTKSLLMYTSYW